MWTRLDLSNLSIGVSGFVNSNKSSEHFHYKLIANVMDNFNPQTGLEITLQKKLESRCLNSTLRKLTTTPPGAVDFSSNDFLSLSTSAQLRSAFLTELTCRGPGGEAFPLGSGGSRLLDGNSHYADALEREIAAFHGAASGLLWNSGFDANAGVFACVPQPGDVIVYDELIHASVHDGMKLSRATTRVPFAHNCVEGLRTVLERRMAEDQGLATGRSNVFIAVESVYSMDGDLAPLAEVVALVDELLPRKNAHIIVDEAHATGVIGPHGRGLVSQLGLENRIFARLHTFGKALACSGAIVLCSPLVRSYLINYARPLIYTTFMPFLNLAAIKASYSLLESGATAALVAHMQNLVLQLHTQLRQMVLRLRRLRAIDELLRVAPTCPGSPIFSLLTNHPRSLAKYCQNGGFVVRAVVPPTVPTRRVRVCLHAGNSSEDVKRLVLRIEEWIIERAKPSLGGEGVISRPHELIKARL